MNARKLLLIATVLLLALSSLVTSTLQAAQITATPLSSGTPSSTPEPTVAITSPLLVSELHGEVEVQGTADVPNMLDYFLEVRGLNDDASLPSDDVPWIPATLPTTGPVQSGLLALWDTTTVP